MSERKITKEELNLLNTKIGIHTALKNKKFNLEKVLEDTKYLVNLRKQQEKLIKLQNWVINEDKKVVILF